MSSKTLQGTPGVDRRHRFSDFYHERTNFNFLGHARRALALSAVLIVVSIALLFTRGLNFGIDFEGGVSWQVQKPDATPDVAEVRDLLEELGQGDAKVTVVGGDSVRVQALILDNPVSDVRDALADVVGRTPAEVTVDATGGSGTWSIDRVDSPDQGAIEEAIAEVESIADVEAEVTVDGNSATVTISDLPPSPVSQVTEALADYAGVDSDAVTINTVGPTWGQEVSEKAAIAMLVFFLVLALYLSLRFEPKMAGAAIAAVVHDVIVTVGIYSLFQFEVTPATVTAFLTILGFSLYDTVVVFDKIKENEKTLLALGRGTYTEMANRSLNAVLMRSLSTSFVALMPVVSVLVIGAWIMGASSLESFGLALFFGLLIGSYSSIFVATPILALWKERDPVFASLREKHDKHDRKATEPARVPSMVSAAVAADAATATGDDAPDASATPVPGPSASATTSRAAPRPRQPRGRKRK